MVILFKTHYDSITFEKRKSVHTITNIVSTFRLVDVMRLSLLFWKVENKVLVMIMGNNCACRWRWKRPLGFPKSSN